MDPLRISGTKPSSVILRVAGSEGRVAGVEPPPPLAGKVYPQKMSFFAIFKGCNPHPFLNRMVDKSSHERLHPQHPFQKFLDPHMT